MGLLRFLGQRKSAILFCLFLYLVFWLSIGIFKQNVYPNKSRLSNSCNCEPSATFSTILHHLAQSKAHLLLIDPYVLNSLFNERLSFSSLQSDVITFGIHDEVVDTILQNLQDTNFTIKLSENTRPSSTTPIDHLFIEYEQRTIHLAVLHKFNSYYHIHENKLEIYDDIPLAYGDTLRAIDPFDVEPYEHLFFYPKYVSHFLWLYRSSKFLHCNQVLADEMENKFNLRPNMSLLNVSVVPMKNVAYALNKLEKRYWLAGGTLLGWYRHCGLIPFTQDADFGLIAEEYDESIRGYFLGNPISYLWGALGLVNDSLEFRLYTGKFTLDLFWAYREGNHRWCGYQVQRAKFRRTLPLMETICSGDLFGYRFSIPCTPVEYLDREYGKHKWKYPLARNYTWINMKYHSMWNDISWMYAVRLYTKQGALRTDKYSIDWISSSFNYSIKTIPSFLNSVPDEPITLPPLKKKLIYGRVRTKKNQKKST